MTEEHTFPEDYPHQLKKISWTLGEIAGPYAFWNRRLDYSLRGDERFISSVVLRIFEKNGVHEQTAKDASQFIAESFSFIFINDQGQFFCKVKSKDKDGKKWVDSRRWHELMSPLTPRQANALLKYVLNEACSFYNDFIFNYKK